MSLAEYQRKRQFSETPEPPAGTAPAPGSRRFCLQRHDATRLHYDLRLEVAGVLKSWAVPKGPSLTPGERKLAVQTEDHPLAYLDWEGVIPKGQYGGGVMMVYDIGDWEPVEERDPEASLKAGELKIRLWGQKVQGEWTLVRTRDDSWLFLKKDDAWANPDWDPEDHLWSAVSGRTPEEIAAHTRAPAARSARWPKGAVEAPMPLEIEPMLAEPARPFDDANWSFELKWDGIRALAFCQEQSVRLVGTSVDAIAGRMLQEKCQMTEEQKSWMSRCRGETRYFQTPIHWHLSMLEQAGFMEVECIYMRYQIAGISARKPTPRGVSHPETVS